MTVSVFEAARHLCRKSEWTVSNLKMQKILYIAHMYHLGYYNEALVSGRFEAWDYGPVHPDLYHRVKVFGAGPVKDIFRSYGDLEEDGKERKMLDAAADQLADFSSAQLVAATHREDGAWAKHYIPGAKGIEIPNEDILNEFQRITGK